MEVESSICLSDLVPALRWSRPQQVAEALGDPRLPAAWWHSVALSRALGLTGLDWMCERLASLASSKWEHLPLADLLPALTVHHIDPALPGWPEATRTAIIGLGGWQRLRRLSPADLGTPSASPEVVIGSVFREVLGRILVQRDAAAKGGHPEVTRPLQRGTIPGQRESGPLAAGGPQTGGFPAIQPGGPSPRQTGSFPAQPNAAQAGSPTAQPQSGSFPAQPENGRQTGSFPAQPENPRPGGPFPPAPDSGPQTGGFPAQPENGRQTGSFPAQPENARPGGPFPPAPDSGPQTGGFPAQPENARPGGSLPPPPDSGPQTGGFAAQTGGFPAQPESARPGAPFPGQPGSGPQTGGFAAQPGGLPQRQTGSQPGSPSPANGPHPGSPSPAGGSHPGSPSPANVPHPGSPSPAGGPLPGADVPGQGGAQSGVGPHTGPHPVPGGPAQREPVAATPAPSETDHAMVRVVDSLFRSLDKNELAVAVHRLFAEDPISLRTLAHKMLVDRDVLSQAQRTAEERVLHWLRSSESAPVTGHMFRLTEWLGTAATQDQLIGADPAHPVMVPSLRTPLWRVLVTLMPDRRLQDGWLVVGDIHGLQARTRQLLTSHPGESDPVELLSELGIRTHSAKAWLDALPPESAEHAPPALTPAQPLPRRTPGANGHHHRGGQPIPAATSGAIDPSAALATLSALSGSRPPVRPGGLAGAPATPPPPIPSPSSDPRRWQRIEVTPEHLRGGPVPVPEGYAAQLGMRPGTLLSVTGPGDNAIVLVWQGHQPVFDSLQPVLMRLNARPGDQVYVTVDGYRLEAQLTG
ncbi:hypothetical protein ABT294_31910 [Nonomuraea sp. NPDC000554]|uniref:hypothetical protein n=1 Tax=Nonomuraea sp. NPDC000554 TaxID=3154259 RepID=UPI0033320C48